MLIRDETIVYACTHNTYDVYAETRHYYTRLRKLECNMQNNITERDIQVYGEMVNQILKMNFNDIPDLELGDHIYLNKPAPVEHEGIEEDVYGEGDYIVDSIDPTYIGGLHVTNPTSVIVKKVAK